MKKLKVELEMVANTMEDVARVDMEYCLEKETGEVIFLPVEISRYVEEEDENLRGELLDWQKKHIKVAQDILFINPDQYINIPEGAPCNGYDLMVEFAERLRMSY